MKINPHPRHFSVFLASLIILTTISLPANAQKGLVDFSDFGNFKKEEMDYKICPFDKDADAVVFYDKAISEYDKYYHLVTTRSIRFKILKEKGKSRGDISIGFYSGDDFEKLRDVKADILTYDDQGQAIIYNVDDKSMYITKESSIHSTLRFALPNVKVGSIIEYKYTSECKNYGGIKDWEFQKDMPVLSSIYKLYMLPRVEFAYTVHKSQFLNLETVVDKSVASIYFNMTDIPGLKDEEFSTNKRDYLQRVVFQQSGYENYFGRKNIKNTWQDLNKELLDDQEFGRALTKVIPHTEEPFNACNQLTSPLEKMKFLHNYIRSSMNWDHLYAKNCEDGLKKVWENKKGNSADINLLLINFLRANGLNAFPILTSEREHGKVDTTYPYLHQFSSVAACVDIYGKYYILDGVDRITPSGITPFKLLNTKGFIIDKENSKLITIEDNEKKYKTVINLLGRIDQSGNIKGEAIVYNFDYAKVYKLNAYNKDLDKYRDGYMTRYPALKVDSMQVNGFDNDSGPLTESFQIKLPVPQSGAYYLLNYNLFAGLEKNPFVSEHRFTDIDFGSQQSITLNAYFTLPDNSIIESIPGNISLKSPDNSISFNRISDKQDHNIRIIMKMDILKTDFAPEDYDMIRGFYKKVFEYLNEPIILKK